MMNKITTAIIALALPSTIYAQQEATHESNYRYNDAIQIWRNTSNASGLTLDSTQTRGWAGFTFQHKGGDYHRIQEGNQYNSLTFGSERYQQLSKHLYGYGNFNFQMGRAKERAWSDVYRSYNTNPYFAGSSTKGSYDNQEVNLLAAISTTSFNGFRYGLKLHYNLGDLSRLRDPRSRANLLEYKITPSMSYTFGANTLAFSAHYNRRKEKIANITTVQSDATNLYYQFSGMENAVAISSGFNGFTRQWVDHRFGAELAYAYRNNSFHSLSTISIESGTESVLGRIKYEPGKYKTYRYEVYTQNRIYKDQFLHQLDFKANYQQGYADEYRQELEITKDAIRGFTSEKYNTILTFKKRYQVETIDLNFRYRANVTDKQQSIKAYGGVATDFQRAANKHLLQLSTLNYASLAFNLEGGISLLSNRRLWIDGTAGYCFSTQANLNLADPTTAYATQVLIPDMEYYKANYFKAKLQVMYQLPINIKKHRAMWYAKVYTDYLKTNNNLYANTFGVSIGVFN